MNEILMKGKYTDAHVFAIQIEDECKEQIQSLIDCPIFEGCHIAIMPDTHRGKGSVIGFTCTMPKSHAIIPTIVGVDQSCGMLAVKISDSDIDFKKLDFIIRNKIPAGAGKSRRNIHPMIPESLIEKVTLYSNYLEIDADEQLRKIGTLGGGNHFISIEKSENETYLIIHSGSRNFGSESCWHFQKMALEKTQNGELSYLVDDDAKKYLEIAKVCDEYAKMSRQVMMTEIVEGLGLHVESQFTTTHNYINQNDFIIRKGAVSCNKGEILLIPINMAYGSFIVRGLGNPMWNNSAPHGAGRLYSRGVATETLSLDEYKREMEGIYTTCICEKTLDEAPMAYKNGDEIKECISDTCEILTHLKPIYNFKAIN